MPVKNSINDVTVAVTRGTDGRTLLADLHFRQEWDELYSSCPWATAFQRPDFVAAWYQTYTRYEPIFVIARSLDEHMLGLLVLGESEEKGEIVVAGGRQAEYQVWLANEEWGSRFLPAAYPAIQQLLGDRALKFQFLPVGTPLQWRSSASVAARLEPLSTPILRLNTEDSADPFKKKSNKSRLNRLAKLGQVTFERMATRAELEQVIDSIAAFYDLRQGAINGTTPFLTDRLKREFHLALMDAADLLHATVLRAGDQLVAAHLGVTGRSAVHLGVLTHSPFVAQHSPGKLQLMFLTQMLAQEGYAYFDLTPGADPWKQRFANASENVHRMTLYGTVSGMRKAAQRQRVTDAARKLLNAFGISTALVRRGAEAIRRRGVVKALKVAVNTAKQYTLQTTELRVYRMSLPNEAGSTAEQFADRDTIASLMKFEESTGAPAAGQFFEATLNRLEEGSHIYSRLEDGRLVHWGWFAPSQEKSFLEEVHQEFVLPPASGVLFDFYTHPAYRRRGFYERSLRQMIRDATAMKVARLYIFVRSNNMASRRVIEKIGFSYQFSFFERKRGWKVARWRAPDTDSSLTTRP